MPVQVRPAVPEAASGDNRPFWAIFLCKENSPQKGIVPRLYSLPGELFLWALLEATTVTMATVETMVDYHGAG